MPVAFDVGGERNRTFAAAVLLIEVLLFADSPVKGPTTVLWVCKFILANGGTPTGWHQRWMTNAKLQTADAGVNIHEMACRMLEMMVCFDQLQLGAVASAEYICLQIQIQEQRWRDRILGNTPEQQQEAYLFAGQVSRGLICVAP